MSGCGKSWHGSVTQPRVVASYRYLLLDVLMPWSMMTEMRLKGDPGGSGCDWSMELKKGTRSKQSSFVRHFRHAMVYEPEGARRSKHQAGQGCNILRRFGVARACLEGHPDSLALASLNLVGGLHQWAAFHSKHDQARKIDSETCNHPIVHTEQTPPKLLHIRHGANCFLVLKLDITMLIFIVEVRAGRTTCLNGASPATSGG